MKEKQLRVFIVEDEALLAMLLEDMLIDLGHEVAAIAGRLDRAEREAASLSFDLAIVDVNLNGEKTYPVAEILTLRAVPFMFATGYGSAGLDPAWRAVPVLRKPYLARDLKAAIESTIEPRAPDAVSHPT